MDSARALPTGIITFLLTDVEGSTRLWEREPEAMRLALARHDAIVNACVRRENGHVVKSKGEGDSVFAVFDHVRDAVAAALVVQCALAEEKWPTSTPIRVRMAIHTGQVEQRDGDYYGPTVNRCARLRALGKGGQVLLSGVAAQLAQTQMPSGSSLKDLGTHQLKDLSTPESVWQLTHPRLGTNPPAPTAQRTAPTASPLRRAYKLTDHLSHSPEGLDWGAGVKHVAADLNPDSEDGRIRCYTSPGLAALLNAQNERFRMPRLWEAIVDVVAMRGDAIVACNEVATTRQVSLPTLTGQHHARFAVLCARAAYESGEPDNGFIAWADGWLAGSDASGIGARAVADELNAEAHQGAALTHPQLLMGANAARAAMHASRMSFLAGRARDEENTRAIELATEATRTALRMTRLDLPALAEQVIPKAISTPVLPARTSVPTPPVPQRILRALPT